MAGGVIIVARLISRTSGPHLALRAPCLLRLLRLLLGESHEKAPSPCLLLCARVINGQCHTLRLHACRVKTCVCAEDDSSFDAEADHSTACRRISSFMLQPRKPLPPKHAL